MDIVTKVLLAISPIWLLLLGLTNLVVIAVMVIRWGHYVYSRWDLVMIAVSMFGFIIFDSLLAAGDVSMETLIGVSRGMRLIFLFVMIFVNHRAMARQRRIGNVIEQWE